MMSECRVLHCDGTFKTCPRPFKQVTFVQYIVAEQPDPEQGDSRKNRKHIAGSVPVSDTDSI